MFKKFFSSFFLLRRVLLLLTLLLALSSCTHTYTRSTGARKTGEEECG
jgi:hypothetical protein